MSTPLPILLMFSGVEVILLVILLILSKKKKELEKVKVKDKKTKLKKEKIAIFIIYAIVIGIFLYFLLANMFPGEVPLSEKDFVISANSFQIFDKLNSFYIDKEVLGEKEVLNNVTVRKISSAEPFNIILRPKTPITDNSSATFEINLIANEQYTSVYLNDKPIIPDLTNYHLLADYPTEAVYIRNDLNYNENSFLEANGAQEFAYKNFPGSSVYSFSNSTYSPDLSDYTSDWTDIDTTFRGDIKLAVFTENNLYISFSKQDLNNYVGKDEYTVEVKDLNGKIYFSEVYEDDGDSSKSGKLGNEEDYEISVYNLPRGIYYITFTKDKYNSGLDSTIKTIKINSNKIVIVGTFLPITSFDFYTKIYSTEDLGFKYWHNSKNQTISVGGANNYKIKLDDGWINKRYDKNLSLGDYNFEIPIGDLWVYASQVSPSDNSWFNIPKKDEGNLKNQEIIIIDKNKLKINGDKIKYIENVLVSKDTKFKLQFIDGNKLYFDNLKLTFN